MNIKENTLPLDAEDPATVRETTITEEMQTSFGSYALSVIVARALPDVRDGMKPVHRRIMYVMGESYGSSRTHFKCARIVGEVMGKFHPHGDSAIYEALVRMGQSFSLSAPLVDGQGNFGSVDGDNPAAMRYTEARLTKLADVGLVQDMDEDIVDFTPNYDGKEKEPKVLPARFPNVLVNGGTGIAVGMATNIPPHNLGEVIDLTLAFMDQPDMTVDEMMAIMPGPDFPTSALIQGIGPIRQAYLTGRGSIKMAAVMTVETIKNRERIIITEIPYMVNKKSLVERIGELVNGKIIEGVSDVRDESTKLVRIVVDIKRDSDALLVMTALRKHTDLMTNFPMNMTVLNSRREPRLMGIAEVFTEFLVFRRDAIRRRTAYRMETARNELERKMALYAARSRVDEVVALIRNAADAETARSALKLMEFIPDEEFSSLLREIDPDVDDVAVFQLSDYQAGIVLDMPLRSLTALSRDRIAQEARETLARIRGLAPILEDSDILDEVMRMELREIKAAFPTPRRTRIEAGGPEDITEDDLIEDRQVVLTLTRGGYVKLTALDIYREQARGGKGRNGMETKEADVVSVTRVVSLRTNMLFFTDRGIAHVIKAWRLPEAAANARGRHVSNLLKGMRTGESIAAIMPMPSEEGDRSMVFVTDIGEVRRNSAADFARTNKTGKIAMKLVDDNGQALARLIAVLDADDGDDIVLSSRRGKCVRFPLGDLRVFNSRASTGVRGIMLAAGDSVIGAAVLRRSGATPAERRAYLAGGTEPVGAADDGEEAVEAPLTLSAVRMAEMSAQEQYLLTVTSTGHGKRFSGYDLRTTARGGQGVALGTFDKVPGELVVCFPVLQADGIVLMSEGGQIIRTRISEIREMGRKARGVRLFDLPDEDRIVGVTSVQTVVGEAEQE